MGAERERFIYSSSKQMLSAEGVWIERRRDGEAELRDPKGSDGGGCWHVVGEEVFQRSCPPPAPLQPPPPLHLSPLFLLLVVGLSGGSGGPPPTTTKAQQKS